MTDDLYVSATITTAESVDIAEVESQHTRRSSAHLRATFSRERIDTSIGSDAVDVVPDDRERASDTLNENYRATTAANFGRLLR